MTPNSFGPVGEFGLFPRRNQLFHGAIRQTGKRPMDVTHDATAINDEDTSARKPEWTKNSVLL